MQDTVIIIFDIFMVTFVASSMITTGLGLSVSQIIEPFKNVKLVILSVIANFIIVPLFAFVIIWLIPVSEGARIGILLLSFCGGAPFIPKLVMLAKGPLGSAVGLMLLLLMMTMLIMPIVVPLVFQGASISSWELAQSLLFSMLIPLMVALLTRAYFEKFALKIQPLFNQLTNLSVLVLIGAVLYLYTDTILAAARTLPVILLFFVGSMAIGYLTGGDKRNARIVLSIGTGLRNPPIAILVASQYFSSEPMAAIVPLLTVIIGLAILIPLAIKIR